MSVQEIEAAAKELPTDELNGLVNRLFDFFHKRWDQQIEANLNAGRLNDLFNELEQEYKQVLTKPPGPTEPLLVSGSVMNNCRKKLKTWQTRITNF